MGHRFNPDKAGKLLDPKRKEHIPHEIVLNLLSIEKNDAIADLGSGNGFFTIPMSQKTDKKVYAIDIEPKMLELLKEHAQQEKASNIVFKEGNLEEIPLEAQSVNKALLAFVTHEVANLEKMIQELKRIIKPNGKILIVEWDVEDPKMGPPIHERIHPNQLQTVFLEKGLNGVIHQINKQIYALLINIEYQGS